MVGGGAARSAAADSVQGSTGSNTTGFGFLTDIDNEEVYMTGPIKSIQAVVYDLEIHQQKYLKEKTKQDEFNKKNKIS